MRSPLLGEAGSVIREITAFHQDVDRDWVAELSCGHKQHVRHRPPFQLRPWVTDDDERKQRIGSALGCPLCDRAELPAGLCVVRSSAQWSNESIPPALLRSHRLPHGTWGWLQVREGELRFTMNVQPVFSRDVSAGYCQAIPPGVNHYVEAKGHVLFTLSFLARRAH